MRDLRGGEIIRWPIVLIRKDAMTWSSAAANHIKAILGRRANWSNKRCQYVFMSVADLKELFCALFLLSLLLLRERLYSGEFHSTKSERRKKMLRTENKKNRMKRFQN